MANTAQNDESPARREVLTELLARYLVASSGEQERLILEYPVLSSPIGQQLLNELVNGFRGEVPDRILAGIALLRNAARVGPGPISINISPPQTQETASAIFTETTRLPTGESIDKSTVTNAQYAAFILRTGYPHSVIQPAMVTIDSSAKELEALVKSAIAAVGKRGFQIEKARESPDLPVVEVNWFDAVEYARWVRKHLPTADLLDSFFAAQHFDTINRRTQRIYEWTVTPSNRSDLLVPAFVIKGGAGKHTDNPPDDLWNELGFRCYSPTRKLTQDQLILETREAEVQRQMRLQLGFDRADDINVLGLYEIAKQLASGHISLPEATGHLTQFAQQQDEATRLRLTLAVCRYIALRYERFPQAGVSADLLAALATLGVCIAQTLKDRQPQIDAQFAVAQASLFRRDDETAASALEECLEHFRSLGDQKRIAKGLLYRGLSNLIGGLMVGEHRLGWEKALEDFRQSRQLFGSLEMPVEEQLAECCVADALTRLGRQEAAFSVLRYALAKTAFFDHPRDEIVGLLRAGKSLLDASHHQYAAYAHKVAYALASELGDPELIGEARFGLFLCFSEFDLPEACAQAAKAIEVGTWLQTSSLTRTIWSVYNLSHQPLADAVFNFLSALSNAAGELNSKLPFLFFAQVAVSRSFLPGLSLQSLWLANEGMIAARLDPLETALVECARCLAVWNDDSTIASAACSQAMAIAASIQATDLAAIARLLRLRLTIEIGDWSAVEAELADIGEHIDSMGQMVNSATFQSSRSELWYGAGRVTAALEAADEALIESVEHLDEFTAAQVNAQQHLLRSRLFLVLGSGQRAANAAINGRGAFFRASNGFGQVEADLCLAQEFILEGSFEAAAKAIKWAENTLFLSHARKNPPLIAEFRYSIAILNHAAGDLELAATLFGEVVDSFRSLALQHDEIRAASQVAAVKVNLGDYVAAPKN